MNNKTYRNSTVHLSKLFSRESFVHFDNTTIKIHLKIEIFPFINVHIFLCIKWISALIFNLVINMNNVGLKFFNKLWNLRKGNEGYFYKFWLADKM